MNNPDWLRPSTLLGTGCGAVLPMLQRRGFTPAGVVSSFGISHSGQGVMDTAKVFWSGRSQAVRLPRAFRVDAREVRIRRRGRAIVLEPVPDSWEWLDALVDEVDADFVAVVREHVEATEHPELGKVFR